MFVFSNTFIVLLPFAAYSLWLAACEERVKRKIKEKRENREIRGKWKCFSAGKTIEIKEFQIEGYVKLLTPLYREQCSMSPSDLHEIIEGSRKNEKNKNFCLSVFRKLILQRLIVKK